MAYDAVLLLSFGGPEGPDDVMPFLRRVVAGRGVPDERLAAVAEHYHHFGGVSPINDQCRALLDALRPALDVPLYWGNRNWHPLLADTLAQMKADGISRALAFVTSPFGSFSSCRQYWQDIASARAEVGSGAPVIDKIRHYHDHPGYVGAHASAVAAALAQLADAEPPVRLVFTAHSIPTAMDSLSGPTGGRYATQLRETAALVAAQAAPGVEWDLVWQSRSGAPHIPWLEPDINDHLESLAKQGVHGVVVSPIGFISDHLEVLWDLDEEAAATASGLGLRYVRAATPGVDPQFVAMVVDLIRERFAVAAGRDVERAKLGDLPVWDACPADCCPTPTR